MRLLADENFNGDVLRGLLRVEPKLDIVRVQDTEVYQASDSVVLAYAAQENRILLTHDVRTVTKYAYDRVRAGQTMPGVIELDNDLPIGRAIEEILVVLLTSQHDELANRIIFVPLS
ncbi:MAG: hypothetical protein GC179_27745 [Anaerolineaceae bacterium]|nr:hypothetical protein [Anaerolineaceae bacterium]